MDELPVEAAESRRDIARRMYEQGEKPMTIANTLGVAQPTVLKYLFIPHQSKQRTIYRITQLKLNELRQIEHVFCDEGKDR